MAPAQELLLADKGEVKMADDTAQNEERGYREPARIEPSGSKASRRWFIKQGAEGEKGPFTASAIANSLRRGTLHRSSLVRAEQDSYWRPIDSVADLMSGATSRDESCAAARGADDREHEPPASNRRRRWSKWAGALAVLTLTLKVCRLAHFVSAEPAKPAPVLDLNQPSIDVSLDRDLCVWDCEDRMLNRQQGLPFCTDLCARLPPHTTQATLKSGLDCLGRCQNDELDRLIALGSADGGSPAKALDAVKANAKDVTPTCAARCFTSISPPEAGPDVGGNP